MTQIMPILALLALTFFGRADGSLQEMVHHRWFILLVGCGLVLAWRVGRAFHWSLALCVFAVTWSGASGAFLYDTYSGLPLLMQLAVKESAASSLVVFILLAWTSASLSERSLRHWQSAIAILGPVTAILVLGAYSAGNLGSAAFFDNPSLVGTTIAVAYPLFMHELYMWRKAHWSIPAGVGMFVAMAVLGTSTQMMAFFGSQAIVLFANITRGRSKDFLPTVLVLSGLTAIMGFFQPWTTWLNSSDRFTLWGWGLGIMQGQPWQIQATGTGLGTTHLLLPLVQAKGQAGVPSPLYFTLHNDWLQIWVEQGLLGAVAALTLLLTVIRRVWNTPWLLGATTAYALSMVTNFTTHFPLQAFIGFILVRLAFSCWTTYGSQRAYDYNREMHV